MIHDPWLDDDAPAAGCVAALLAALGTLAVVAVVLAVMHAW